MSHQRTNSTWTIVISGLALVGSVITVSILLRWTEIGDLPRLLIALVPVAAYIVFLINFLRLIRTTDEMQRRIHLEALAIAFPSSAVVIFAFEYLRKAGFVTEFKPDYALVPMIVFWAVGFLIARKRYQ